MQLKELHEIEARCHRRIDTWEAETEQRFHDLEESLRGLREMVINMPEPEPL